MPALLTLCAGEAKDAKGGERGTGREETQEKKERGIDEGDQRGSERERGATAADNAAQSQAHSPLNGGR